MAEEARKTWMPSHLVTRRQVLIGGSAAALLAACGGDDDDDTAAPSTEAAGDTEAPATEAPAGDTTAPAAETTAAAPASGGGILRLGTLGGANDLIDGQHIVSKADIARIVTGWESLLNFDPDYNIVNTYGLAEEVEQVAADNYIIHLKEGIKFSNGDPVTADDVIYSFTRMLDPESAVFGGAALRPILSTDGMTKIDDLTVEIKLLRKDVTFTQALCAYTANIVPVGYARFDGDPTNQIGTGPYMLKEFEVGVQSIHVKNPNYWLPDTQHFDEVHIIDFADGDAMMNALLADQIDVATDIPVSGVDSVKGDDNLVFLNSAGGGWLSIVMAVDMEPFTDVRVRQAMRLIPDRQKLVDVVLGGYGTVANDLFGPLDAAYIGDELPQRDQDIEGAKALLAEAGMSDLTVDFFAPNDTAGLPELVQAFSSMASEAGITVNPVVLDGGEYWGDQYLKRAFATDYWGTRTFLAQVAAGSLPTAPYPGDHWPPAGSTFIEDYEAAVAETDPVKQKAITDKMQKEMYETGGLIIAFFQNQLDAYNKRIGGVVERPNTLNFDHFGRGYREIYFTS